MKKANLDIRESAKKSKIPIWQIAYVMGITEQTLLRKLRFEFSDEEKQHFLDIVEKLKNE